MSVLFVGYKNAHIGVKIVVQRLLFGISVAAQSLNLVLFSSPYPFRNNNCNNNNNKQPTSRKVKRTLAWR